MMKTRNMNKTKNKNMLQIITSSKVFKFLNFLDLILALNDSLLQLKIIEDY